MYNQTLKSLAYRMLGSVVEAEDVLQDAQIKLLEKAPQPDNEQAFLFRVVSNLCIDRLRRLKRERKTYPGPWLPEPVLTESVTDEIELAESLTMGFTLMLERLSPAQRCVFVFREAYDFSFSEIAEILDVNVAACRQRYSRAKSNLRGERRFYTNEAEQKIVLEKLLKAVQSGNAKNIVKLLHKEAVALTDGGGVVSAAIVPVTDPNRIAQVMLFLFEKLVETHTLRFESIQLNSSLGLTTFANEEIHSCFLFDLFEGKIKTLYVVRNPEKLKKLKTD